LRRSTSVSDSIVSSELQTAERQETVTTPPRSLTGSACSETRAPTSADQHSCTLASKVGGALLWRSPARASARLLGGLAPIDPAPCNPNVRQPVARCQHGVEVGRRDQALAAHPKHLQQPCAAFAIELTQHVIE
jgi:hypothetical protein